MKNKITVFWFRRDLRLNDNAGLSKALALGHPVLPVFIFDETILNQLEEKQDRRVDYIHQAIQQIHAKLKTFSSGLSVYYGRPLDVFKKLHHQYDLQAVFCNRDYEPQAIARDTEIYTFFSQQHILFKAVKDQVIFDKNEVLKNDGTAYTVYTPYAKKWKEKLTGVDYKSYSMDYSALLKQDFGAILSLHEIGFVKTDMTFDSPQLEASVIDEYDKYRDYPALAHTTHLGIALRFGTISIRKCVAFALQHNPIWLNELIWREFFMQILYHFPLVVDYSFKTKYDKIQWRNNEHEFNLWCAGNTGYPIVDAGMRQLNQTGFMHNRVRMIVASFLCKHLLIDWRWGEAYFAQKLNDFELSANNGNWQWAAGSGCDAAPYFRVFNPALQTEKFDKKLEYIKKWIPEYGTADYPPPIVDHKMARDRALATYSLAVKE